MSKDRKTGKKTESCASFAQSVRSVASNNVGVYRCKGCNLAGAPRLPPPPRDRSPRELRRLSPDSPGSVAQYISQNSQNSQAQHSAPRAHTRSVTHLLRSRMKTLCRRRQEWSCLFRDQLPTERSHAEGVHEHAWQSTIHTAETRVKQGTAQ
jgi:hypothetical protein